MSKELNTKIFNQKERNKIQLHKSAWRIPLHVDTQFHEIYQEQFEASHPSSKPDVLHLGVHKAGWFLIKDNSNPTKKDSLKLLATSKLKEWQGKSQIQLNYDEEITKALHVMMVNSPVLR